MFRRLEREQALVVKPEMAKYRANLTAWESKKQGIMDSIRLSAKKTGKPDGDGEGALQKLEMCKPLAPRVPRIIRGDETPENLAWVLARVQNRQ